MPSLRPLAGRASALGSLIAFVSLALLTAGARTAHAEEDPYAAAMATSAAAEQRGDLELAARALEAVLVAYPQDHELRVKLGWVLFRARRFAESERAYQAALDLAPQSMDARLGLGWSRVRQGQCDGASAALEPMLAAGDPRAEEILQACEVPSVGAVSLFAAWNQYFFPGHPYKSTGTGVLVGASARTAEGWTLQGAFRHVAFTATAGSGISNFTQQEAYAHVGYSGANAGLLLQGALVFDGSGAIGTSKHVGLAARWSPAGDLLLDASLSVYDDRTIGRLAPSWSIPVAGPLRLVPGAAFQLADGEVKVTGSLTAALSFSSLELWAGGKYGEEIRPAYLSQLAIYNVQDRIAWGAWAGARVKLGSVLAIQATYAIDRLRRDGDTSTGTSTSESNSHALSLGPVLTF